ncbi:peptide-methionine (S)-S-oxide reductase [Cerasibacillus quisquiliarum]|uniref:Peptide methionine sulfoxide reductase MsrA n=1 Tax=Cerasibacillus quisquiliarum TaxID=227865 RepID=A0A511UU90_9BACI|nr:peptide-methionine (S)-S-oxide reductase MsrA [Cerasibacillus quisquiliarum]MBB5144930.1 peptide-methionine (S)-S-oxide reductase [Cerasibacillus quisquiliarum]GEN30175.1 peptide methionine sulfoxide reductase MsrA [Cerasibacillus quisquiliarum]
MLEKATFAGGCFWCMVKPFDQWDGVHEVISGYTGGELKNPTYTDVKSGTTGHVEAVQITFNPDIIRYEQLLHIFWRQIDPTDPAGQFHDRGSSYQAAIFYHNEQQKQLAEQSKQALEASGVFSKPIVTPILPAKIFYPAEDEHQHFYKKNKRVYEEDRKKSGRDAFLQKVWTKNN